MLLLLSLPLNPTERSPGRHIVTLRIYFGLFPSLTETLTSPISGQRQAQWEDSVKAPSPDSITGRIPGAYINLEGDPFLFLDAI